jgi:hypothetical protein
MKQAYKILRGCVFHNPLGISCLPPKLQGIAANYLNRSVGLEVECEMLNEDSMYLIAYQKDRVELEHRLVHMNTGHCEQKFRIGVGEKGLVDLYHVSEFLKKWYGLNISSGIHYHVDCTSNYRQIRFNMLSNPEIEKMMLKELKTWDYTGHFNRPEIVGTGHKEHVWACLRERFNTIEYRIGEMTFEYSLLIKRVLHAVSITNRVEKMVPKH